MGKTKGFQKLCSRLCPKALRARFGEKLSGASEVKRIKSKSLPSLVFMSRANHLKYFTHFSEKLAFRRVACNVSAQSQVLKT